MVKGKFPEGMPPHQIEAIKRGGSAVHNGERYTLESLGLIGVGAVDAAVDADLRLSEAAQVVEELEARLLKYEDADGNPLTKPADVKESPEYKAAIAAIRKDAAVFVPDTKEALEALSPEDLAVAARLKGVKPPKDAKKDDIVALLAKKESA